MSCGSTTCLRSVGMKRRGREKERREKRRKRRGNAMGVREHDRTEEEEKSIGFSPSSFEALALLL